MLRVKWQWSSGRIRKNPFTCCISSNYMQPYAWLHYRRKQYWSVDSDIHNKMIHYHVSTLLAPCPPTSSTHFCQECPHQENYHAPECYFHKEAHFFLLSRNLQNFHGNHDTQNDITPGGFRKHCLKCSIMHWGPPQGSTRTARKGKREGTMCVYILSISLLSFTYM